MFSGQRLTLLIIPEEGGRTYEFKIRRISVWLLGILGVGVLVLLGFGVQAYTEAAYLNERVARLQHGKALLEEEVALMVILERKVSRLESRNVQYTRMLSGSVEVEDERQESPSFNHYIPGINRLRWGRVRTVPSLWPVRGVIKELHSPDRPGVVIAAREGSLIRASAAGQVERISFDERPGACHCREPRQRHVDCIRTRGDGAGGTGQIRPQGSAHRPVRPCRGWPRCRLLLRGGE